MLEVQARHPGNCNLPQSVSGEEHRQKHSQRASGERETQTEPQQVVRIRDKTTAKESAVKRRTNEVKQHGYEDSEKYIEATMRSQSSAQRREGEK